MKKQYYEHIIEAVPMPPDIGAHFSAALSDLYNGPKGPDYWREEMDDPSAPSYSFVESCKVVSKWFNGEDWPQYMDEECYPLDDMDRVNLEEDGLLYYEVDMRDLKHELFGELASYI